jgi:hypothetical protein
MRFISWQEVYSVIDIVLYAELIKLETGRDNIMQKSIEAQELRYSGDYERFYLQGYEALYSGEIQPTTRHYNLERTNL